MEEENYHGRITRTTCFWQCITFLERAVKGVPRPFWEVGRRG